MEPNKIYESSYLDLLFEGRNRAYGAYDLRTRYPQHLRKALGLAALLFVGIALLPALAQSLSSPKPALPPVRVSSFELPPPPPKPQKVLPPPPPATHTEAAAPPQTIVFKPPVVVADAAAPTEPPHIDDMAGKALGQQTNDGKTGNNTALTTPTGKGTAPVAPPIMAEKKPELSEPVTFVEQMPAFPGGEKALFMYLAENIKYPTLARENGIDGRVYLQFVVEKDGRVSGVKVARSVNSLLDEEAVRVVREMPKWLPGKQNGNAVRVSYHLPIIFELH